VGSSFVIARLNDCKRRFHRWGGRVRWYGSWRLWGCKAEMLRSTVNWLAVHPRLKVPPMVPLSKGPKQDQDQLDTCENAKSAVATATASNAVNICMCELNDHLRFNTRIKAKFILYIWEKINFDVRVRLSSVSKGTRDDKMSDDGNCGCGRWRVTGFQSGVVTNSCSGQE